MTVSSIKHFAKFFSYGAFFIIVLFLINYLFNNYLLNKYHESLFYKYTSNFDKPSIATVKTLVIILASEVLGFIFTKSFLLVRIIENINKSLFSDLKSYYKKILLLFFIILLPIFAIFYTLTLISKWKKTKMKPDILLGKTSSDSTNFKLEHKRKFYKNKYFWAARNKINSLVVFMFAVQIVVLVEALIFVNLSTETLVLLSVLVFYSQWLIVLFSLSLHKIFELSYIENQKALEYSSWELEALNINIPLSAKAPTIISAEPHQDDDKKDAADNLFSK